MRLLFKIEDLLTDYIKCCQSEKNVGLFEGSHIEHFSNMSVPQKILEVRFKMYCEHASNVTK